MRLAVASDHAGLALKRSVAGWLEEMGHEVVDIGPSGTDSVDYPDYAHGVCEAVAGGEADRGVLVCNSGIGMSMAANRHPGIRAALCLFPRMAWYARHHNDANVLVMGGGITAPFTASEILQVFLAEDFDGGRHGRRVSKIEPGASEE